MTDRALKGKSCGTIMGLPVFETEDLETPKDIVFGKLTKESARNYFEELARIKTAR